MAIIFGEDDAYTIWFLTGYRYKAEFSDGYTETGSYSVKDGSLELHEKNGGQRIIEDRWMDFGDARTAAILKADFSDSARIIGEFNENTDGQLVITDPDGQTIAVKDIKATIDNPYAYEILTAIVPEEAK